MAVPVLTTQAASQITRDGAFLSGNMSSGTGVIRRGFQFNTVQANPGEGVNEVWEDGSFSTGPFYNKVLGLLPGTQYFVRAFAENSDGRGYGGWVNFFTLSQSYNVTINSIDRTADVVAGSLRIEDVINDQVNSCQLMLDNLSGNGIPTNDQEIVITLDDGTIIFGGYVVNASYKSKMRGGGETIVSLSCTDYTRLLDSNLVHRTYEDMTDKAIIEDIVSRYCAGFGITTTNVSEGVTIDQISFNYIQPSQAIRRIAELSGRHWYIDYEKDIHYFPLTTTSAPYNITADFTMFSVELDGDDDSIQIADNNFDGLSEGTVELRFKAKKTNTFQKLIFKDGCLDIGINSSNELFGEVGGVGNIGILNGGVSYADGQWHILRFSWDGSFLRAFADGEFLGKLAQSGNQNDNANPLYIGHRITSEAFRGLVDEFRISDVARSNTDDDYTPADADFTDDANTLVLLHMNEGTGTSLTDASGNGNTGTLSGGSWSRDIPYGNDGANKYYDLNISKDSSQIKNRVYVRGGTKLSEFTNYVEVGDGEKRQFILPDKPHDVTIEVDRGGGYVEESVGIKNVDTTGYKWYLNFQEKYVDQDTSETVLSATDKFRITYKYDIPILVAVENTASILANGQREFAIFDKSITTSEAARARASAELTDYANRIIEGSFGTYEPGFVSGQYIHIEHADYGVDDDYLIQRVTLNSRGSGLYEYQISLASAKTIGIIKFLVQLLEANKSLIELDDNEVIDELLQLTDSLLSDSLIDSLTIDSTGPYHVYQDDSAPVDDLGIGRWGLSQYKY